MKITLNLLNLLKMLLIVGSFIFSGLFFIIIFIALFNDPPSILGAFFSFLFASLFGFITYRTIKNIRSYRDINKPESSNNDNSLKSLVNSPRIVYTPENIPDLLRVLNECIDIVNTSKNIETVIGRLYLGARKAYNLEKLEEIKLYSGRPTSSDYLEVFVNQKGTLLNNCIERAYKEMLKKADMLKTKKGIINRCINFIEELHKFNDDYWPENEDYIKEIECELEVLINTNLK